MDSKELRGLMEAYSEVYATEEEIEEKFVDPSHGSFDDPKRIGMKSPARKMMDKHKELKSKGDPESNARADKIAKAKLQTTLRAYGNNVDEATAVASPAPGGRGRKNPYTKEVRTSASTKTSSGYSNVKDAKDRMKKPLSRYSTKMQLKDVKEAQYTPPPQPQQPPAEVRKAPKKAPNPMTTVGTGLAAAYVGNEIGKQLLKKKPVKGVFEEVDIYDIVLSHLLDEGYAETLEAAEVIMVNMSEEWRESIVEGIGTKLAAAGLAGIMGSGVMNAQNSIIAKRQYPGGPLERDKTELVSKADKAKKDAEEKRQAELYIKGRLERDRENGI